MVLPHITPRGAASYLLQGVYGAHIVTRMWRLSRQPASDKPLHIFLLSNTDVILVLTSMPVVWHIVHAKRHERPSIKMPEQSRVRQPAHQLRQVFTALLLGLGLLRRRIIWQQSGKAFDIIERLERVIAEGIRALNVLDPPTDFGENGSDLALEK